MAEKTLGFLVPSLDRVRKSYDDVTRVAEDDGGGVVMSVVVHLEPGSKANGGPSEPEGATLFI